MAYLMIRRLTGTIALIAAAARDSGIAAMVRHTSERDSARAARGLRNMLASTPLGDTFVPETRMPEGWQAAFPSRGNVNWVRESQCLLDMGGWSLPWACRMWASYAFCQRDIARCVR